MKVIEKLSRLNINKVNADIGIEIEVEGKRLPKQRDLEGFWRVDADGSLRGESAEYVTPPIKFEDMQKYLDVLQKAYAKCGSVIDESIRTGVHVHLNVQQLTTKQMYNLATLYFILEDLLVHWCGPSREGNHFCLRSRDAEYVIFKLVESLSDFFNMNTDTIRYCSLNLYSLFKYGTVEFRSMRGTGDLSAIATWVNMLYSLRNAALEYHDPVDIILSMSGDGEEALLRKALPDHYHLFNNIPGYQQLIRDGARRMQMLAYATDWSKLDEKKDDYKVEELKIRMPDDWQEAVEEVLLEIEEEEIPE